MTDEPHAHRHAELPGTEALGEARTLTEETAQKLVRLFESSRPVRTIRGSQVASGFVGAIGLALFVLGVERATEDIPVIDNAWGSIVVGLILLAAAGALLRRLTE